MIYVVDLREIQLRLGALECNARDCHGFETELLITKKTGLRLAILRYLYESGFK